MSTRAGGDAELERARLELRRLGYLDHGLERFLLQDALRPRQPLRTMALLAAKVGLLTGGVLAASLAAALVLANGSFAASPLDLPVLFLHLFPPAAAAAYALVRLIYQGLLALAIRFTERAPAAGLSAWRWRRWASGAVLAGVLLLAVPVVLAARGVEPPPPPLLPVAPGERVLVIGLDGVLPEEIEYLLRRGDLPAMARLERNGARLLRYGRPDEPPAAFWTSVATGLAPPEHGVAALDSFLPAGVSTPLARSGLLRPYFSRVEVPLGLADYRPVLANRRSAFTFWELASRGGAPVVAVNWWATFPAPPLPGLVLAHDAYQLLRQGVAGAVSPAAAAAALRREACEVAASPLAAGAAGIAGGATAAGAAGTAGAATAAGAAGAAGTAGAATAVGAAGTARTAGAGGTAGAPGPVGITGAAGSAGTIGAVREAGAARAAGPAGTATAAGATWTGEDVAARRLLAAALPAAEAAAVAERSVRPDEFYARVFAESLARKDSPPRAAALYLPGLDIAAAGWHGGDVAFADLVRAELGVADRLLVRALAQPGWGTVAVVLDPGRRRHGGGGRVLLWQRRGCDATPGEIAPEALAAGLLRTLGLPQSAELPPPPAQCRWPEPPAAVASYGRPQPRPLPGAPAEEAAEYLRNLRSLGYL